MLLKDASQKLKGIMGSLNGYHEIFTYQMQ